jgi:hypothetical protein
VHTRKSAGYIKLKVLAGAVKVFIDDWAFIDCCIAEHHTNSTTAANDRLSGISDLRVIIKQ